MKTADTGRRPRAMVSTKKGAAKRVVTVFSRREVTLANARVKGSEVEVERFSRKRQRSESPTRDAPRRQPMEQNLKALVRASKARREKAKKRQAQFRKRLRATMGEMSILEMKSVKEPQRKDYLRRLDEFYDWVSHLELPLKTEEQLDAALCDYADIMYLNGESNSSGQKLKAALEFHRPEAFRRGELFLPRFKRALKGWRRAAPTQTRMPMLEFVKGAISAVMVSQGWREMALCNELSFSTYARPGELMKAKAMDVVERNSQFQYSVLVLSPFERGEGSKTGVFDEVLVMDDVRVPWLGQLMVQHSKSRMTQDGENANLWSFSPAQFLQVWRSSVHALGVQEVFTTPYQNRHGGASRDHLLKLRTVPSIQRRGRWAVDSSARIYDKPGRLQQLINQFSTKLQPLGESMRRDFEKFFQSGTIQLPAPVRKRAGECFKI